MRLSSVRKLIDGFICVGTEFDEKLGMKARTLVGESMRKEAIAAVQKSIDLYSFKIADALFQVMKNPKGQPRDKIEALKVRFTLFYGSHF